MLLCFVDESNAKDFFSFAGLIADENATKALTDSLNAIMQQAHVDYGIPASTEIHGHPLFHGKESWYGVGPRARVGIHLKVTDAILEQDVTILMRSVGKQALRDRQAKNHYPVTFPPEQVCFQHILQRIDEVAKRQRTYALVVADERGDRERHRQRFATYQAAGTPGVYMHTTLDSLLDTVHFAPSHHSRMLQAADMLAFTYRRHRTVQESDARSERAMGQIWERLESSGKLYSVGQWP